MWNEIEAALSEAYDAGFWLGLSVGVFVGAFALLLFKWIIS